MSKPARYGLRFETVDGTVEDVFHKMPVKADALRAAKIAAKNMSCADVVRVWVDDICEDIGIASFPTKYA